MWRLFSMTTSRSANLLPSLSLCLNVGSITSKFLSASRYLGRSWSCSRMMICCSMRWWQAKANLKANFRSAELIVWFIYRKSATTASGRAVLSSAISYSYTAVGSSTARYPKWKNCAVRPSSRDFRKRSRSFRYTLSLIQVIELRIKGFKLENYLPRSYSKGLTDSSNLVMTRSISSVNLKVSSFYGIMGVLRSGSQSLSTTQANSSQKWVKEGMERTADFFGFFPQKMELIWCWQRLSMDCISPKILSYHCLIDLPIRTSIFTPQIVPIRITNRLKTQSTPTKEEGLRERPKRGSPYTLFIRYDSSEGFSGGKSQFSNGIPSFLMSQAESKTKVTLTVVYPSIFTQDRARTP